MTESTVGWFDVREKYCSLTEKRIYVHAHKNVTNGAEIKGRIYLHARKNVTKKSLQAATIHMCRLYLRNLGISMSFSHSKEQKGVKHAIQGERKRSSDQSSTVARWQVLGPRGSTRLSNLSPRPTQQFRRSMGLIYRQDNTLHEANSRYQLNK